MVSEEKVELTRTLSDIVTYLSTDCSTTVIDQWPPIPLSEEPDCGWFDPVKCSLVILLLPLTVKQYWDHWQCEHSHIASLFKHDICKYIHSIEACMIVIYMYFS